MKKKSVKVKVSKSDVVKEALLALQDNVIALTECVVQGAKTEEIVNSIKLQKEKLI